MATKAKKVKRVHYEQFVPARLDSEGKVAYYVRDDFSAIGNAGCRIGQKDRTPFAKNAMWFWSPNDAKAFCVLAGGPEWVVLKRTITYEQL